MTHTVGNSKASQRAWLSVGAPILALVLVIALGAAAVFVGFAQQQNRAFQQDSLRLVGNALSERGRAISDATLDFASWNDAYQNISVRWDSAWVDENYHSAVVDGLLVFRADGAMRHIWFKPPLSNSDRRLSAGLLHAGANMPGLHDLRSAPQTVSTVAHGIATIDGNLALIAVAAIAPEETGARLALQPGADTDYLAGANLLDARALADLGATLGLDNLHFDAADSAGSADNAHMLSMPLSDASGAAIGALRWRDERPGDQAFAAQMAPAVLGLLLIGALTVLLTRALVSRHVASIVNGQAAEESSQLKSEFISTMSHGLRTPLHAIIGYAELIEEEGDLDPNYAYAREDAGRILTAARQLGQLVDDTLDQTRIDAGRLKLNTTRLDVRELLSEIEDVLSPMARANGNQLRIAAESSAMYMTGDHQRVRQCLLNIAGNAIKFTKDGTVDVRARQSLRRGAAFITFDISDTGMGIEPEHAKHLFEPFAHPSRNVHRADGGVGLGLAISRKLARAMGGDIDFVSEPGAGSCFSLHLPVAREARQRAVASAAP